MSHSVTETMTAADTDVPGGRGLAPARPQGAPLPRLACLLLDPVHKLSLLVLLLSMPACIIPIGPEFRDPPGNPNAKPFFWSTDPPIGSVSTSGLFAVTPSDDNVEDHLFVRWIADYPPFEEETTRHHFVEIMPRDDGRPLRQRVENTFECSALRRLPTHQIMAIVSDRPYLPNSQELEKTLPGGDIVVAAWTWDSHDCPQ
jgi:hypothetical protein